MRLVQRSDPLPTLAPETSSGYGEDELLHYYCCDEDVALCGTDVSESEFWERETEGLICVVCSHPLTTCSICGE